MSTSENNAPPLNAPRFTIYLCALCSSVLLRQPRVPFGVLLRCVLTVLMPFPSPRYFDENEREYKDLADADYIGTGPSYTTPLATRIPNDALCPCPSDVAPV